MSVAEAPRRSHHRKPAPVPADELPEGALGTCCRCRRDDRSVLNVITLELRCAIPGHGWGCLQCRLPSDGATAVVCDPCMRAILRSKLSVGEELGEVCRGYPATEGREPYRGALARGPHAHDLALHRGER